MFIPKAEWVIGAKAHHMNVDYSCYKGMKVCGQVEVTMQRGKVLVENGTFYGKPRDGKFLARSRFGF